MSDSRSNYVNRWRAIGGERPDDKSTVLVCFVHLTWPESGSTYHFLNPDSGEEFEAVTHWANVELPT